MSKEGTVSFSRNHLILDLSHRPAALVNLVTKSWQGVKSRDHHIYAVFPFGHNAEEVMLHGRSNNVPETGEATTFTWAAHMHFRRDGNGKVLIDKYTIFPVSRSFIEISRKCLLTEVLRTITLRHYKHVARSGN